MEVHNIGQYTTLGKVLTYSYHFKKTSLPLISPTNH